MTGNVISLNIITLKLDDNIGWELPYYVDRRIEGIKTENNSIKVGCLIRRGILMWPFRV